MTDQHPITVVSKGSEYRLDQYAYGIRTKNGIHAMSGMKGSSLEIPGRTGSVFFPGRRRGPGAIYLSMYVQDTYNNQIQGSDPYATFLGNQDTLFRIFNTRMGQIEVREYIDSVPEGAALGPYNYRGAMCEVGMSIAPELKGRYWSEMTIECIINDGSWYEKNYVEASRNINNVSFAASFPELDGISADIEDAVLVVCGPINQPRIIDPYTGHTIYYSGSLGSGQHWSIDCKNFLSTVGAGIGYGTANGTSVMSQTTWYGAYSPGMFGITALNSTPYVVVQSSSYSSGAFVGVRARRRWL